MTVRIVTDSACDLRGEEVAELRIEVVPLSIRFGTEEFVDREELTVEEFYRRLGESDELPETSAPSPGRFGQAFTRQLESGADTVICINMSSGLSATMQSARTAANDTDADIRVIDSRTITAGLGVIDTMGYVPCDVATHIIGQAASMGSLVACSGTKGKRHALPNSKNLMHQPLLAGVFGVINIPCITTWALGGTAMGHMLRSDRQRRQLNVGLGLLLVATVYMINV